MTSFSHTAPRFTDEDRQREHAVLTDAERKQIDDERKGAEQCSSISNEEDRHMYLSQMEKEIHSMSLEDRQDYERALILAPELVESESGSLKFLRKHNFNTAAAARNLVIYWTWRVQLFQDKAFLPMTIDGALQDDFDTLSTGFIEILPEDSHGRAVVYHEKRRANPKLYHRDSLLRVVFYIYHVVSQDVKYQKKGFVLITNTGTSRMEDIDRLYTKKSTTMTLDVIPVRLKALQRPCSDIWFLPNSIVEPVLMFVVPKDMRVRINSFTGLEALEECGISSDKVPLSIGGTYTRPIEIWLEQLRSREEQEIMKNG